MANYITIPDMVEAEPMLSFSAHSDGVTFSVVIDAGETATRLMHASTEGRHIPLVVLATEGGFLALDDVYVTEASMAGGQPSAVNITFAAQAVRFI